MSTEKNRSTTASTWLERGLFLALILACAVALSPNLTDADLWGHVQYGLDALSDGLPAATTYSFTAEQHIWINHENLAEVVLAIVATAGGGPGLLAMKCLLGLGVIALVIRQSKSQGAGLLAISVVALLVSVNVTYHWSVRPQVFSYTLFALLMAFVTWCFGTWQGNWNLPILRRLGRCATGPANVTCRADRGNEAARAEPLEENGPVASRDTAVKSHEVSRRLKYLWLVPILFVVWANTHGGFVAGYCIVSCLLACRAFEVLVTFGRLGWKTVSWLFLIVIAAGLATMFNPYGWGLHSWLWESLGNPRPEIAEWHPPDLTDPITIPLLLITGLCVATILLTRRPLDFSHLAVLSITLWQSYEHQRHVPFFAIAFGLWMTPHVDSLLRRLQIGGDETDFGADLSPKMRGAFAVGLSIAFFMLAVRLYDRIHELEVERDTFPVAAFQYMADQDLRGKMVVTYNWAQYAIAAFGTKYDHGEARMRIGFDGRFRTCYPQEIVDMHFDFVLGNGGPSSRWRGDKSPPFDPDLVLEYKQPNLVLISRYQTHAVDTMQRHRDRWVLLYQDELAQLWGRSTKYDNPHSDSFIAAAKRRIGDESQVGSVRWPALPEFSANDRRIANTGHFPEEG